MLQTKIENIIQIVAKDNTNNILIIMSWDFNQNSEHSMYQIKMDSDHQHENQITRGLYGPLNYYMSEYFVYDLQNNIPFQSATHKIL